MWLQKRDNGRPLLKKFDFEEIQDYVDTFDEINGNRELSLIFLYRIFMYKNDNYKTILLSELERLDFQINKLRFILSDGKKPYIFKSLMSKFKPIFYGDELKPDLTIFRRYDELAIGKLKRLILCHGKAYIKKFECALTLDSSYNVCPDIIANMYSYFDMRIIPNRYFDVIIFCGAPILLLHAEYRISEVKKFFSLIIEKIVDNGLLQIISGVSSPIGLIETIQDRLVRNIKLEFRDDIN